MRESYNMSTELTPRHLWTNGGNEVLIVRFVEKDGTSYRGQDRTGNAIDFKHPTKVGESVVAPDWIRDDKCGAGIHGWPWGFYVGDGKFPRGEKSMTATETIHASPDRTKMYGLLHNLDGSRINRQVRSMKVGFGVPTGKDIHVWINDKKKWCIETGNYDGSKRSSVLTTCDTKEQAKLKYAELRRSAPERKYPRKFPYFTFLRLHVDGTFVPEFDAIEQHGPTPSEIDIVFLKDDPLDSSFQWWTAAELKCEGDGLTARRRLYLAKTTEEKQAAKEATERGERFFPIVDGCFAMGCAYARGDKPSCKPHGRLHFQLLKSPRIGGTCTYDTTGFRSIEQMDSCLQDIRRGTGRGEPESGFAAGIPLKFVLRPYKTSYNGQPSVQYAVSMEFRGTEAVEMVRELKQHAQEFREAMQIGMAPLQLTAGGVPVVIDDEDFPDQESEGAALTAEFYGEFQGQEQEEGVKGPKENPFVVTDKGAATTQSATANEGAKQEVKPEPLSATDKPSEAPPAKAKATKKADPSAETKPAEPAKAQFKGSDDDLPAEMGGKHEATKPVEKPTQPKRFEAITKTLMALGNSNAKAVGVCVQNWTLAFLNQKEWFKCPQKQYDEPLDFLERAAEMYGADILKDAHAAGLHCAGGWNKLTTYMEAWSPESRGVGRAVAVQFFPDDPALLQDFLDTAQAEGQLPESELIVLMKVYQISTKHAMEFKAAADAKGVTMRALSSRLVWETATEADVLALIAGKPNDDENAQAWEE